jgi:hypothetical protein
VLAPDVKVHNGATSTLDGHENPLHVTDAPEVPAKVPVGVPPTVTPVKKATDVALPRSVLLRLLAVPLMSIDPVIGLVAEMTGGRAWRVALALWLNANITAQKAAERIATLFVGIMFILIGSFRLYTDAARQMPRCKALLNKYLKYLSITWLRHDITFRLRACPLTRIVKYSDDSASSGEDLAHNGHGIRKLQRVIGKRKNY